MVGLHPPTHFAGTPSLIPVYDNRGVTCRFFENCYQNLPAEVC